MRNAWRALQQVFHFLRGRGRTLQGGSVRQLLDNTIRPIYEAHGLLRVAFPKIETAPAKDVDGVTLTVEVTPGPPYKLDHVSFVGADYSRSEWNDLSKLKIDQTVNFDEVKAAQERVRADLRRKVRRLLGVDGRPPDFRRTQPNSCSIKQSCLRSMPSDAENFPISGTA